MEIDESTVEKIRQEHAETKDCKVRPKPLEVKVPDDFKVREYAHKKTNECIQRAVERFKEIAKKGLDKYE